MISRPEARSESSSASAENGAEFGALPLTSTTQYSSTHLRVGSVHQPIPPAVLICCRAAGQERKDHFGERSDRRKKCIANLHLALRIAEYFEVPTEVVFSTRVFPRIG